MKINSVGFGCFKASSTYFYAAGDYILGLASFKKDHFGLRSSEPQTGSQCGLRRWFFHQNYFNFSAITPFSGAAVVREMKLECWREGRIWPFHAGHVKSIDGSGAGWLLDLARQHVGAEPSRIASPKETIKLDRSLVVILRPARGPVRRGGV
jgi:hypothetical protein